MAISPLLTKGILGVGVAGATVAGAAYIGGAFSESNKGEFVSTLIKTSNHDKRLIISKVGTDSHWKEAWKIYREDNKDNKDKNSGEDVWKISGWTKPKTSPITNVDEAPSHFMSACNYRLSQKTEGAGSSIYKEALRYCTRDALVEDWIKESGKILREKGDGTSSEWKALWTKYREANKNKNASADEWGIFKKQWTDITEENAPSEFRERCETESRLKARKFDEVVVKKVLAYCV